MPISKSGRIVKTQKGKGGTLHQRNHRWESFTSKISRLNSLDAIRRVRRHDIDAEDLSTATSYLKTGLEKWQELSMAEGFITFYQQVLPMCDSLPQILHFENKIMEVFTVYMEKRERESMEPLLELITDFAHDIGPRFEKHYAKTLELITAIAGTPQDAAVIESSFSSLAFLFKYLSKLLTPDLRPTYDLMAPLLGKHRQQPHIARFAAEAMSFLVKKAAAPAHRENSLPLIIRHAKEDLEKMSDTKEFGLYYHGLMTLFAEAMKGNGRSVHTSGPSIIKSLIAALNDQDLESKEPSIWMDVICGVLTSIIHHTESDTFKEVLGVILGEANAASQSFVGPPTQRSLHRIMFSSRTIGTMAGVRKGNRVTDWQELLKALSNILRATTKNAEFVTEHKQNSGLWNSLVFNVAITLQYTPMDAMIPFISPFMDSLTKDPLAKWFLTFCSYLSASGVEPERFRSIVLPYFKRFIVVHWSEDNGDALSVLLPKMVLSGVLPDNSGGNGFTLPQSWQDQMVSKFERLEVSPFPEKATPYDGSPATWHDRCLPKYNALLEVLQNTAVHPSTNARIAEILLRKLKLALRPSCSLAPEEANFIMGRGFRSFSRMTKGASEVDRALEPLLRAAAPRYARLPNFLEALLEYEVSLKLSPKPKSAITKEPDTDVGPELLVASLVANLSTASHYLRLLSLRLLEHIYTTENDAVSEALSVMIQAEQTPLGLQTAESALMHIRKLATLYSGQPTGSWLKEAMPSFCFGMLTVKFAKMWKEACTSLKQMSESREGEEIVAKLAFQWLETPSVAWDGTSRSIEQEKNNGLTDFECSNFMRLEKLAKEAESNVMGSRDTMLQKFAEAQEPVPERPPTARAQALQVLAIAPGIAEKRSRQLVPMFLSWASKEYEELEQVDEDNNGRTLSDWTRKDQKAQLDLFPSFQNPKSLFKSVDVYHSLLQLLANGDIEIQRSAMKAIFTWKNANVKPYEENLLNLLDEARFKEELAILLQGESLVQQEHRPTLMPILLRTLYGRTISRKGAGSGKQGMEARRRTVLRNLSIEDTGDFLDIALGDLKDLSVVVNGVVSSSVFEKEILSVRKQVGFTYMIQGILKEKGSMVVSLAQKLVDAILYCTVYAARQLQDDAEEIEEEGIHSSQTSLLKVVRQTGLKCLILLFTNSPDFDWSPYIPVIEQELIAPRLENLPIETAQGISVILRLFSTWSTTSKTVLFLGCNKSILRKVAVCLAPQKSKDEVKLFALNIIKSVVRLSHEDIENPNAAQVQRELLTPNMDLFLIEISGVLRGQYDLSKNLLEACVETVSELALSVTTSSQAHNLVDVSVFLLDQPPKRVGHKTKGGLILVLEHFIPLYDLQNDPELKDRVYKTTTSLFGFFKDKLSREVLSRVIMVYSKNDPIMAEVATLCVDLNSFVAGRLDEPDYDRRLKAFNAINCRRDVQFTPRQWTPLLYNMLFYIDHDEEHGILSSNSSDGMCEFINSARKSDNEGGIITEFKNMLSSILIPALFLGVREPSEVIRREYVKVMAHLIRSFPNWPEVNDMHGLLAGEEETENSFFNNILTASKGKQSDALKQIRAATEEGKLSAKNVSHFFIPLIENFIFDRAEGNDAHNLAAEATTTIGTLARSLEWPQYRSMLMRFISYIEKKSELKKQIIRLLGKVIDALALVAQLAIEKESSSKQSTLSLTLPRQEKLSEDLIKNILPTLTEYLHDKDDSESIVSLRVPVAVIIVQLLKLLTQEQLNEKLPPVLTDICHILRSKAQESRDMARDTLTKICILLGPSCVGFVLKELRGALARGYQLHVLSYTMHSILVAVTPEYAPGDLDYCLPSIMAIIMDDIFGATGQEKDAEEYTSKMKEVKSSKSHDSMELIAKTATLSRLTDLVRPIQQLLKEKLNLRMVRKIDELLNRITNGLLKNTAAESRDSLVFCYEVVQDVYNSQKPQAKVKEDYRLKRYLIQKGAKRSGDRGSTMVYTFKLVRFAFDVLRSVLKKYDSLRTTANLAGFIKPIGNAIIQPEEEVKIAAFRLLTTIVKVPLQIEGDGTNLYRVAAAEATSAISANPSTASDISQAALKLMSVVLRDRRDVLVKDITVDKLLERFKKDGDITEPDRRHATFNFLRAVLDSKVETAVVYKTLDDVREVMVTNNDKDTRDLARGAYFQFLREYPQKKRRWSKQLEFLVGNLSYDREWGRLSVLKVVDLLLSKSMDDFVQEVSETFFRHLIKVLANDESQECREAAGGLLKTIFKKADAERISGFLKVLRLMIQKTPRVGFQIYGFYFESHDSDESDIPTLYASISSVLATAENADSNWDQIYAALELTYILVATFPCTFLSSKTQSLWSSIYKCLSFPHAWVKISAARLTSTYFADFTGTNSETNLIGLPLKGSNGLILSGENILDLIRRTAQMFKAPVFGSNLADEVVKNLAFLAKCAGNNNLVWRSVQDVQDDDEAGQEDEDKEQRTALDYVFGRLSFILRRETSPPRIEALVPKQAALQLASLLTKNMDTSILIPCLETILLPLHNITDPNIPVPYSTDELFLKGYEALKADSEEIMEGLKKRVGTSVYTEKLLRVREGVKQRRLGRSMKRKVEAVSMPERFGENKRKKTERKKERRKEKGNEFSRLRNEI